MTRQELIDYINNFLSASCSLPYTLPEDEINRIIDVETKWLYREYRDTQEKRYYILDKKFYQTPQWKENRVINMPDCVQGIVQIRELTGGSRIFGLNDPDLRFDRLMASDLYLTPLSSDQVTYRTVQWSFWDLAKAYNLIDIRHSFNINTHQITILGRQPVESLWICTINKIPLEQFYDDPIVMEWMANKCLLSLARILGTFNYTLLGGITISFDSWKTMAEARIKELNDKIIGDSPADWFLSFS